MTLKEIALKTNTSISTVSRVLNNRQPYAASKELRKTIWDIALESGYLMDMPANNDFDKQAKSPIEQKTLCVLITCSETVSHEDTFFTEIIGGIRKVASQNEYLIENIFHVEDFLDGSAKSFLENKTKPNLITVGYFNPYEMLDILNLFENIINISLNILKTPYDQINCDGFEAARSAIHYLHELNHKEIAFIGSKKESRLLGYQHAFKELDLSIKESLIITDSEFTMKGGEMAMEQLLANNKHFTAVFCMSDRVAIGVLKACQKNNLRVPEDISIIGMNDVEIAEFASPTLTTIHIPMEEMGKVATTILIDRAQKNHSSPLQISMPWYIKKRNSCAIAKK